MNDTSIIPESRPFVKEYKLINHHQILDCQGPDSVVACVDDYGIVNIIRTGKFNGTDYGYIFCFLSLTDNEIKQKELLGDLPKINSSVLKTEGKDYIEPTGMIILNIDQSDNNHLFDDYHGLTNLKNKLKLDKFIKILAFNPRGKGLKIWLKIPKSLNDFKKSFYAIEKYFFERYSVVIHKSSTNIYQYQTIPYDPDVYSNLWSEVFEGKLNQSINTVETKSSNIPSLGNAFVSNSNLKIKEEQKVVQKDEHDENGHRYLLNKTPIITQEIYSGLPQLFTDLTNHFDYPRVKDVILVSALAVLSVLIPNVYTLLKGKKIYSPLYMFIAAPAASGKGAMQFSYELLELPSEYHRKNFAREMEDYKRNVKNAKEKNEIFNSEKPKQKCIVIPADNSRAKMVEMMEPTIYPLIFQTEADTLTNTQKQEWGDNSDILRNAFHHEPISIARKNLESIVHVNPSYLGMMLSGTFGQIKTMIPEASNGLFSRITFYAYEDTLEYISPFHESYNKLNETLPRLKEVVFKIYKELYERTSQVELVFTQPQKKKLDKFFSEGLLQMQKTGAYEAIASFNREQVVFLRIAMILSILRMDQPIPDKIVCDEVSFETSLALVKTFQVHNMSILLTYEAKINRRKANVRVASTMILDELPKEFTTCDVQDFGKKFRLSDRTIYRYISDWKESGLVTTLKAGSFSKTT